MRVYEATIIDKCASPDGEEPISYESYVAVGKGEEIAHDMSFDNKETKYLPKPYTDEDIHYYFTEDEWRERKVVSGGDIRPYFGEIETEEFKYLIGKRVA